MDITQLLAFTVQNKASDLHISAGMPPLLRVDGDIRRINTPAISSKDAHTLIYDILSDHQRKTFEADQELDAALTVEKVGRFRMNIFNQNRGIGAAFRVIPAVVPTLDEIHAPEVFKTISLSPRGLVLVTGPTGSGKSTSLAAMIDHCNRHMYRHILTIEDPIEFVHESKNSLINQREVYTNTGSFDNALRAALREDPDVILVGELRDLETIRLALTASSTGHLVFGTLHTTSAAKTVNRIIDVFPSGEKDMVRNMLSESLNAVVCQTLLKRKDEGRIAAHEIMVCTPAIRNLIREDKAAQMYSAMQTSADQGMITLDQTLRNLVSKGLVEREVAKAKSNDPDSF